LALQRHDRTTVIRGRETGMLVRTAGGGFIERHEHLSPDEQWALLSHEQPELQPRPQLEVMQSRQQLDARTHQSAQTAAGNGKVPAALHPHGWRGRLRHATARLYFSDQMPRPTPQDQRRAADVAEREHAALRHEHGGGPNGQGGS
jgi:ubiquinol-cytochrome c reductase cytochrome b subunit